MVCVKNHQTSLYKYISIFELSRLTRILYVTKYKEIAVPYHKTFCDYSIYYAPHSSNEIVVNEIHLKT